MHRRMMRRAYMCLCTVYDRICTAWAFHALDIYPFLLALWLVCRKDFPLLVFLGDSIRPVPIPWGSANKKLSKVRVDPAHSISWCGVKLNSLNSFITWAPTRDKQRPWFTNFSLCVQRISSILNLYLYKTDLCKNMITIFHVVSTY